MTNPVEKSREELIKNHLSLVRYIAKKQTAFLYGHVSIDELCSYGVEGLIDAANRFDSSKGLKFKTFADRRIRGAMLDGLRDYDWVPRSVRQKANYIERTKGKLTKKLGRQASEEEISVEMGISIEEVQKLFNDTKYVSVLDIDSPLFSHPSQRYSGQFKSLFDCDESNPLNMLLFKESCETARDFVSALPERENEIISLYYFDQFTMREIGDRMDLSEARISQLHAMAISKMLKKSSTGYWRTGI